MEEFLRYWGLDWFAMALSLLSVYLLGNKNRVGFLVFAASNSTWIFLGLTWMIRTYFIFRRVMRCGQDGPDARHPTKALCR